MRLNVKALALACGLLWGLGIFALTWWVMLFDGPTGEQTIVGQIYRGFTVSPGGSFLGLIWGFFDGLVGGALLGWLYNAISSRMKRGTEA